MQILISDLDKSRSIVKLLVGYLRYAGMCSLVTKVALAMQINASSLQTGKEDMSLLASV